MFARLWRCDEKIHKFLFLGWSPEEETDIQTVVILYEDLCPSRYMHIVITEENMAAANVGASKSSLRLS